MRTRISSFSSLFRPALSTALALGRDVRGDVAVEYIVLVGTVALVSIPAFAAAGSALAETYERMRNVALYPVP